MYFVRYIIATMVCIIISMVCIIVTLVCIITGVHHDFSQDHKVDNRIRTIVVGSRPSRFRDSEKSTECRTTLRVLIDSIGTTDSGTICSVSEFNALLFIYSSIIVADLWVL